MLVSIALLLSSAAGADAMGWGSLYPALKDFHRSAQSPKREPGARPAVYSQDVVYERASGGKLSEVLIVTLARDAKFKERYSVAAMAKENARKLEVNKKTAYLWDRMKPDDLGRVNRKLVVVLADDRVLVVQQIGTGLELDEVAKLFDFDKVLKALDSLPPADEPPPPPR